MMGNRFAIVVGIGLALIIFGVLGYMRLGVEQFPAMEFPVIVVSAILEGASPEAVEEDVTDVLEEHLNSIAGVRSLRSSTWQNTSVVVVAKPPSAPRAAIDRMYTPGSSVTDSIRIRSPSSAPPLNGLVGSTATTATVLSRSR